MPGRFLPQNETGSYVRETSDLCYYCVIKLHTMYYYITINIKLLKMGDKKTSNKRADITRYRHTYLISSRLPGCLRMLPLCDAA